MGKQTGKLTQFEPEVQSREVVRCSVREGCDFGTRDFVSQKDYFHFAGGLKGDITERYSYDGNFNYNRSDEQQTTLNAENFILPLPMPIFAGSWTTPKCGSYSRTLVYHTL